MNALREIYVISSSFVCLVMNIHFKQLISIRSVAMNSFSCQIILKFLFLSFGFFPVYLFSHGFVLGRP